MLPSSMTTTSCWAYSWISVNHAWKRKESTEGREKGEREERHYERGGSEIKRVDGGDGWMPRRGEREKDRRLLFIGCSSSCPSLNSRPCIFTLLLPICLCILIITDYRCIGSLSAGFVRNTNCLHTNMNMCRRCTHIQPSTDPNVISSQ